MRFTICSYNVLAAAYLRPQYYPFTDPALLDPTQRRGRLLDAIAAMVARSEVVCLQEVEPALFGALESRLDTCKGYYLQKTAKPDGVAIFVRRGAFAKVEVRPHRFTEAEQVAIAVVTEVVSILTTHLVWEPPDKLTEEHRGYRQMKEILDTFVVPGERWIVCGDLNAVPDSAVIRLARAHGLEDAYEPHPSAFTANANGRRKRIDFFLHSPDFTATPQPIPPIADDTPLPSETEPSDHLAIAATFTLRTPQP